MKRDSKHIAKPTTRRPQQYHYAWVILAVCAVVLMLCAGSLLLWNKGQHKYLSKDARNRIQKILTKNTRVTPLVRVASDLGYEFSYDTDVFNVTGITRNDTTTSTTFNGDTFTGDDLKTKRGYIVFELYFKNLGSAPKDKVSSPNTLKPYAYFSTNKNANYFDRSTLPEDVRSLSDLDLLVKAKKNSLKLDSNATTEVKDIKIRGYAYKLLKVTRNLTIGDKVVSQAFDYYYMTSQNGRPYWFGIYGAHDDTGDYTAALESVLASASYTKQTASAKRIVTAAADSEATANYRGPINDDSLLTVVAKNQLATVRVAYSRCAHLTYRAANGATLSIPHACNALIGSGSFITADGYIATNGHVVDNISDEDLFKDYMSLVNSWQPYYDFVQQAGYATAAELNALYSELKSGNNDAYAKILGLISLVPPNGITITEDTRAYRVQTSNIPLGVKIDRSSGLVEFTDTPTNITAKLIDAEVNHSIDHLDLGSKQTDVAILKAEGTFPTVKLSSLSGLQQNSLVTVIGYPALVDDGLTTKLEHTVPTVSQGEVVDTLQDGGHHNLVRTSADAAPGNSGGPVFNETGTQIGLLTYSSSSNCDNDDGGDCFGSGIARDGADLALMAKTHGIQPATGTISAQWEKGLGEFAQGQYHAAAETFKALNQTYPNYLVAAFAEEAAAQPSDVQNSADAYTGTYLGNTDKELTPQAAVGVGIVGVLASLGILVTIVVIIRSRLHQASYTPPLGVGYQYPPVGGPVAAPSQAYTPTAAQPAIVSPTPPAPTYVIQPTPSVVQPQTVVPPQTITPAIGAAPVSAPQPNAYPPQPPTTPPQP